jgi:hypothetical protein
MRISLIQPADLGGAEFLAWHDMQRGTSSLANSTGMALMLLSSFGNCEHHQNTEYVCTYAIFAQTRTGALLSDTCRQQA